MSLAYNHFSRRARLARLSRRLSGPLGAGCVGTTVILMALSGLFLWMHQSTGWVLLTFGIWPLLPLVWNERYLKKLPVNAGDAVDDRLEVELLSRLPARIDQTVLVDALGLSRSAQFIMVRAGVSPRFIGEHVSDEEIARAWEYAVKLQPSGRVKASAWLAGLVNADETLAGLLPHLQIDQHDIDTVVRWYDHIEELIEQHKKPRFTGGVARDWNFGYAHYLSRFGTNISEQVMRGGNFAVDVEAHTEAVAFLTQTFSSGGRQNVALVGATGSGKTAVIRAFAESLMSATAGVPPSLKFRQVVSLDASSIIAAASGRGEVEQLVNALLVEAYRAKNIILCFDDAQLFFEEGVGSVDISTLLQPVIDGGVLRVIFAMDQQRFLRISGRNPNLAQSLNRFVIAPASYDETMRVMQDQLIVTEFQKKVTYMYQALREAYRLSERYMYDLAQPGRALQLLTMAGQYAEDGLVTAGSVQKAVEKTQGVKVGSANAQDREKLLNLETLIHQRMINQVRAVSVVSNALRRSRAGVRNEKRPIGTFLFLGPTGVGKTELAKALAGVYFDGEEHLVRLDMNEFVSPHDVQRLIADGATDPHSLSAQVMKQPFSVVLLDELEKAHDSVLATLLQVLDEGILRDAKGREVSFRDCIIIATSNAGADQIRHHIDAGEELEQFEEALQNELISSGQFRPEFLNRFDEIVLFRPLGQMELAKVVDLILAGVNDMLAPQKIKVEIDVELKAWLVVKGNDPRLGARPMRRMVQRVVENVMAQRLLSGQVKPGETVSLTVADIPPELK